MMHRWAYPLDTITIGKVSPAPGTTHYYSPAMFRNILSIALDRVEPDHPTRIMSRRNWVRAKEAQKATIQLTLCLVDPTNGIPYTLRFDVGIYNADPETDPPDAPDGILFAVSSNMPEGYPFQGKAANSE